jgi:hypothetical protein
MKKTIILSAICFSVLSASAQIKDPAKFTKVDTSKYEYFYKVPPDLFNYLMNTAHAFKDGLIFDPNSSDTEVRKEQVAVSGAIRTIQRTLKLDSLKIKPDTSKKH